jgi:hypothetical protein
MFPVEPLTFPVNAPQRQAANVPAPSNPVPAPAVRLGVTVIDGDKVQAQ